MVALLALTYGVQAANSAPISDDQFYSVGSDLLRFTTIGDGFPLVLLGGGSGMDIRQWRLVVSALSERYRVIQWDPRGIGASDNPTAEYTDIQDLFFLLEHLQLQQVGLLGLSSSGGIVLEFAANYPERVSGAVVAAPFIPAFQFKGSMLDRLKKFNSAAQQGRETFLDAMFGDPHFFPAPSNRKTRDYARKVMAYNYDKGDGFDPRFIINAVPPLIERLKDIKTPTLLLAGKLDHPEVMRRNGFIQEQLADASIAIIDESGHNPPQENPIGYLEVVLPFLNRISQP